MEITAATLDDLMFEALTKLLNQSLYIKVHKGVVIGEIAGAVLRLTNPRARISMTETRGKTFSAIGELMWYLSKTNRLDFINYYIDSYHEFSDDGKTVYGGYGPRLFGTAGVRLFQMDKKIDQFDNVIKLLKKSPTSRKAVIQLFRAEDITKEHRDIPCTCTIQLLVRDNKLSMVVFMRSNDAFLGLPHDVFSFTMLQEMCSCMLNLELGEYIHMVGNLHLYENRKVDAERYVGEGRQSTKTQMPPMPQNDISSSIKTLRSIEKELRTKGKTDLDSKTIDKYWLDIARMLQIFRHGKDGNVDGIIEISKSINPIYKPYIEKKIRDLSEKVC